MSAARLRAIVEGSPVLMDMLRAVQAVDLPDAWIAAGAIRSAVWDVLHGRPIDTGWADVDVLYFDGADTGKAREAAAEARLAELMPGLPWEVRNQARMHLKTGRPPYRDTEDGLRNFAETPTAVGVRLGEGGVEI
ncbi:MAG: nucleotidyltransferase family protein, partial [Alphaproteobacteria bacterium]|nr:nucleotidyltransferase family protein [Alphaproteobacteria bacterium]